MGYEIKSNADISIVKERTDSVQCIGVHRSSNDPPLVSVIVPVYNVENYIRKCIDSIIIQTYQNLEILLIDDGTPDTSGQICEDYAKRDSRIRVFHKENGGLSDARNFGIDHATGDYLTFIDSDDYIDEDYIEFLYRLIAKGYKLALCSLHVRYMSNGRVWDKGNGKEVIISGKKCIEMMCYHDEIETAAYGKLIHKSLFQHVRFPRGKVFEDIGTMYLVFDQCEKIICSFVPKYNYIIRDGSIVTSGYTPRKLDFITMTDEMADYVEKKYPDLKKAALRRRGYARFSTLNLMLDVTDVLEKRIRKDIIQYLKKISNDVTSDPKTPKRDKIAYFSLKCGFPLYRFLWKLYIKKQRG